MLQLELTLYVGVVVWAPSHEGPDEDNTDGQGVLSPRAETVEENLLRRYTRPQEAL